MKNLIKISTILLLAACLFGTGCAASKKSKCGCTGMVGYK